MPNYFYKAIDANGRWVSGETEANDHEHASARLLEKDLTVQSLTEAELPSPPRSLQLSRQDLIDLVEQLSSLTRSGLPLPSGLRAAGNEVVSRSLRASLFDLADKLEAGGNLQEAMESTTIPFPAQLRGLIQAGANTGRLSEMLTEFVRSENLSSELRRMFVRTLAYPALALVAVVAEAGFICGMTARIISNTGVVLNTFGRQPVFVNSVMSIANFLNEHGLELLVGLVVTPLLTWFLFRFGLGAASRRRFLCSIPVIGPILRFTAMTQFCHLLALFIEANLPLPRAFVLAGSSVRDADMADACGKMGRAIEDGESLATAMRQWPSIPAGLGQLFQWSEERQSLPGSLHLAGDMFESRARLQSSFASSLMATLLLLLTIWWIGFAVALIYLPVYSLIQIMSMLIG